jgi:hypothetical protein
MQAVVIKGNKRGLLNYTEIYFIVTLFSLHIFYSYFLLYKC